MNVHLFVITWLVTQYTYIINGYHKTVTLTPSNLYENGATFVVLQTDQVYTTNSSWKLFAANSIGFHFVVTLNETWGFHTQIWSSIVIKVNSDTALPADGLGLVISPSVNDHHFFTTVLYMDEQDNNQIYPDTCAQYPNTISLATGNVAQWVLADTGDSRADKATDFSTTDMKKKNLNNGYTNDWPLIFTLENDVEAGILSFVYSNPTWELDINHNYEQVCCFDTFATNKGLDFYFAVDDIDEAVSITSIEVTYWISYDTSEPTLDPTFNPTTDPTLNPSSNPTISPTVVPTVTPTVDPSSDPTTDPSINPTYAPTVIPTANPTLNPTVNPTIDPTIDPTTNPTRNPTTNPTASPSTNPVTFIPTTDPTTQPIFVISTSIVIDGGSIEDTDWTNIQYIILCIIMMIAIGILLGLTVYKFSKSDGILIMKKIRTIAVLQMMGFFLSYLLWMVCIIILYNDNDNHLNAAYVFFAVLQYFFWIIGWILFYILLIYKLFHTFNESKYRMSKRFIYFHIFITLFIPVWYSIITVSDELDLFHSTTNIYFALSALGTILISFGMLTLMVSFNRNLFIVVSTQRKHSSLSANFVSDNLDYYRYSDMDEEHIDNDNTKNMYLNDVQTSMLDVVTKQTLLGSVMLFAGLIYLFMILFISALNKNEKESTEWILYEWFLGGFININLFCIYFGWKMNKKEYTLFCGKCHSVLILLCESLVKRRMMRKRKVSNVHNELLSNLTVN